VNPHDTKKRAGWLKTTLPAARVIPHSDASGTIVAVGAAVSKARIGERVWAMRCDAPYPGAGGAAERARVASEHAIPLPDHVSFEVGACLGVPAMTAHAAVFGDGPVTGRTVLVTGGAGAVASYAIQLAVWNGARVIATASTPEKQSIARENGAEFVIDYRSSEEETVAAILQKTDGRGVDRIVEVDFGANVAVCHRVLAPNGVVAAYSSSRVREPVLPYYPFAMKGAALRFVQGMLLTPSERDAGVRTISALLARDKLRHCVAASFPLDKIADAHAAAEAGTIGKVVVRTH
jgi:NADPH:quinone reductase-like Zn-dependent oxidoreductase